MTGGWLTPEDQAMWDAAALTVPAPEHREALRRSWPGQHLADPGLPAGASGQAGVLRQTAPVQQVPWRLPIHTASPGARAQVGGLAASAAGPTPGRALLADGRAEPVVL